MNEILENLQNPVPFWLFLLFLFLGFAGFNTKSDKRKTKVSNKEKSVFDQLYGKVRPPKQFEEDLSKFTNEEQRELEKLRYVRAYLNLKFGRDDGLWSFEQVERKESYSYNVSSEYLVLHIYHGEKRVGELGIGILEYEVSCFHYSMSVFLDSHWLEAQEVRNFLMRLSTINYDGTDENIVNRSQTVERAMSDAIWDKLVEKNMNNLEGFNVDDFWMRPLKLSFYGNFDGYFETTKDWEKREQNPFELEKEIFEESNQS